MVIADLYSILKQLDRYKYIGGKAYKLTHILMSQEATAENIEQARLLLEQLKEKYESTSA